MKSDLQRFLKRADLWPAWAWCAMFGVRALCCPTSAAPAALGYREAHRGKDRLPRRVCPNQFAGRDRCRLAGRGHQVAVTRARGRRTQNPFFSLSKVRRSTRPASTYCDDACGSNFKPLQSSQAPLASPRQKQDGRRCCCVLLRSRAETQGS
jgi:hypothetical protein